MKKILRNAIRCRHCGEVIESKSCHDYVTCRCGRCSVDGGREYIRWGAKSRDDFDDLSEITEVDE